MGDLGGFWGDTLGGLWGILGHFGAILGGLGGFWGTLGDLGGVLAGFGGILGLWGVFGPFTPSIPNSPEPSADKALASWAHRPPGTRVILKGLGRSRGKRN